MGQGQRGFLDEVFGDLGDIGRDLLGTSDRTAGPGRSAAANPARPPEPRDRFLPMSIAPLVVLAAVYATHHGTALAGTSITPLRTLASVIETIGHWTAALIVVAVLAVIVDITRFVAHRHRTALLRTVTQATSRDPLRVRVRWQVPGPLRAAKVRMPRGTVIPSERLTKLREAIESSDKHTIATGRGWDDVDLDEENVL